MLEICMHYANQHFYGVCEGTLGICGAKGILFTSNSHYLSFKGSLSDGCVLVFNVTYENSFIIKYFSTSKLWRLKANCVLHEGKCIASKSKLILSLCGS